MTSSIPTFAEAPADGGEESFSLDADAKVDMLGMAFSAFPPDPVIIKRVEGSGWALLNGVRADDELLTVNGANVVDMEKDVFSKAMRQRPLRLGFSRPKQESGAVAGAASV